MKIGITTNANYYYAHQNSSCFLLSTSQWFISSRGFGFFHQKSLSFDPVTHFGHGRVNAFNRYTVHKILQKLPHVDGKFLESMLHSRCIFEAHIMALIKELEKYL